MFNTLNMFTVLACHVLHFSTSIIVTFHVFMEKYLKMPDRKLFFMQDYDKKRMKPDYSHPLLCIAS